MSDLFETQQVKIKKISRKSGKPFSGAPKGTHAESTR